MSDLFFCVVVLCFVAGFMLSYLNISASAQRRLYWSCACAAGVSGALSTYPNWDGAATMGILPVAAMVVMAYVSTPYLKLGGRVYALTPGTQRSGSEEAPAAEGDSHVQEADSTADSYGLLTPAAMWWTLVVVGVIAAGNVYGFAAGKGSALAAVAMAAFLVLLAVGTGYADASWRYRVARGQFVQFGLVSTITAGSFALVYLGAYHIAQRRPLQRMQSMDRRAHPRSLEE